MEWYINDLSINGQFENYYQLREVLEKFLSFRSKAPEFKRCLYCSKQFSQRPATGSQKLYEVVLATKDKQYISHVLEWVNKSGPFWEDSKQFNDDDLFYFQTKDVTDQGLGECARRLIAEIPSCSYSFTGSKFDFERSPLNVVHGLLEDPLRTVDIENFWSSDQVADEIEKNKNKKIFRKWSDVNDEIRERFTSLIISEDAMVPITPVPYSKYITGKIFILLQYLSNIVEQTGKNGELSQSGLELFESHFGGIKKLFGDESTTNKRNFKKELTFRDPKGGEDIFCPWHGKIKVNQIRIHFEWPRPFPKKTKGIKVVYIGPKITKE